MSRTANPREVILELDLCILTSLFCPRSPKSELLKHIDADNLPSCYGGNARFEWSKHKKPKSVYS